MLSLALDRFEHQLLEDDMEIPGWAKLIDLMLALADQNSAKFRKFRGNSGDTILIFLKFRGHNTNFS